MAAEAGTIRQRFDAALAELNRQWPAILARMECAHPVPLPIDGREYHRRLRARRKRKHGH